MVDRPGPPSGHRAAENREPRLDLSPPVSDRVAKTTCYMCACRCGIDVHIRDGRVRYIEGNRDHPVNKGVLCAKGSTGIMQRYSPGRLRKPRLRTGERGRAEFREIECEEALQLAVSWLKPAPSNGFQTCRALHLLQILLGAVDCAGGFRFEPPYPKSLEAHPKPTGHARPNLPLGGTPLGFHVHGQHVLELVDELPRRDGDAGS